MRTNRSLHTTDAVIDEIMAGSGKSCTGAARHFPAHRGEGDSLDPSSVWRWMTRGISLPDGRRAKLEAARIGGRVLTSEQAIRRFISAQIADGPAEPTPTPRTPRQRERAAERAGEQLERIGI